MLFRGSCLPLWDLYILRRPAIYRPLIRVKKIPFVIVLSRYASHERRSGKSVYGLNYRELIGNPRSPFCQMGLFLGGNAVESRLLPAYEWLVCDAAAHQVAPTKTIKFFFSSVTDDPRSSH